MLWRIPLQPRIKHFLWRAIHNCLPVGVSLAQRKVCDPSCRICGADLESLCHCLFQCWIPSAVAERLPSSWPWFNLEAHSFEDLLLQIESYGGGEAVGLFANLLWNMWKARCSAIYDGKPVYIQHFVVSSEQQYREFAVANQRLGAVVEPRNWQENAHLKLMSAELDLSYAGASENLLLASQKFGSHLLNIAATPPLTI